MLVSHVSDVWLLRISCDNLTASHLQDPLCFEVQNYCLNSGKLLFAFRALTLLVGRQEVHLACKNWVLVWLYLEQGADSLHMVQLMLLPSQNPIISCLIEIQTGFTFLVLAITQVVLEERPLNWCSTSSSMACIKYSPSTYLITIDCYCFSHQF